MNKGITLVELMVTILIVAILSGLMLPILSRSQQAARRDADIVKLHQIGLAASLYTDETGHLPRNLKELIGYRLPEYMAAADGDPTPEGFENRYLMSVYKPTRYVPYKMSFMSLDPIGTLWESDIKSVHDAPAAGWLIDITDCRQVLPGSLMHLSGKYRRLLFDGSVVTRDHEPVKRKVDGMDATTEASIFKYADFTLEWKLAYIDRKPPQE